MSKKYVVKRITLTKKTYKEYVKSQKTEISYEKAEKKYNKAKKKYEKAKSMRKLKVWES